MRPDGAHLVDRIDATLPQTQCTRCGYPDCRSYAQAIALNGIAINRCPPGGQDGIERLARVTGLRASPLDAERGIEGPRKLAFVDETHCIGCTLCIKACPVDCIVGSPKRMHTVIESDCTGCELCVPACPVDCIHLEVVSADRTGWQAWSEAQAQRSRAAYAARQSRAHSLKRRHDERQLHKARSKLAELAQQSDTSGESDLTRKRKLVQAAIERAQRRQLGVRPAAPEDDSHRPVEP